MLIFLDLLICIVINLGEAFDLFFVVKAELSELSFQIVKLIGVGGFLVFNALSLKLLAWQFLGYGVLTTCVFLWVQLSVTRLLRHA